MLRPTPPPPRHLLSLRQGLCAIRFSFPTVHTAGTHWVLNKCLLRSTESTLLLQSQVSGIMDAECSLVEPLPF